MSSPMNFNPDDPTVWLWKKLLKMKPHQLWRKPLTDEQKEERALAARTYFADHEHPRKGKPFKNKKT